MEKEIAILKQQPHKPQFSSNEQSSFSATKLLKKKDNNWHKAKRQKIEIDQHVQLQEADTCDCGSKEFEIISTTTKIVQGLIIKRNNTAYHGRRKKCRSCGKVFIPQIPAEVKGLSFDSNTQTITSFMKFACRFTHPLLHTFFTGFGLQISYGQITNMLQRNSKKLYPAYTYLRTIGIQKSLYLQSDATGTKRKRLVSNEVVNQHLHFLGNRFFSLFKITLKYNAEVMKQLVGRRGMKKVYLSDDASPNGSKLKIKKKQLDWIHEIRHYLKLWPKLKVHRTKAEAAIEQLLNFYHQAKDYKTHPTTEKKIAVRQLFDAITQQRTGFEALDRQLGLTKKKRERLLVFLTYPFVPIDNNQAERDLREAVIIRKISRETKSQAGDRSIERHLSVIQTAKKQGLNAFDTLHGLLTGNLPLTVLTTNFEPNVGYDKLFC